VTYRNPKIPEGINGGRGRPLRDLVMLGTSVVALGIAIIGGLMLLGGLLAPLIPFSWERAMAGPFAAVIHGAEVSGSARLQELVDDLSHAAGLPDDMTIKAVVLEHGASMPTRPRVVIWS
jgi:hypothetical protein